MQGKLFHLQQDEPDLPGVPEPGAGAPLAERMRPRTMQEYAGQGHLVGPGRVLEQAIAGDSIPSMIFWGPPGSGKTTLAFLIARHTGHHFMQFSAVTSGIKDLREAIAKAKLLLEKSSRNTILFVDEIHRWNKAQQDAFLPHVENGTVILIGATTENPSFEVIGALLSRCRVFTLKRLTEEEIRSIVQRALEDKKRGLGQTGLQAEPEALEFLAERADGDARRGLNYLELSAQLMAAL